MSRILIDAVQLLKSSGNPGPETFFALVFLDKSKYCEKCLGEMKKDEETGWFQCEHGNIAGWEIHTYTCSACGHKHEKKISRD